MDLLSAETPVHMIHEQLKTPEMRCIEFHSLIPQVTRFSNETAAKDLSLGFGNHIDFTLSNPPMLSGESF